VGCLLLSSKKVDLTTTFTFFINSDEPSFLLMAEHNYWIDTARYELEVESDPRSHGAGA
jgi:hypothetical protein